MRREIEAYWGKSRGEHHRYRSWEHCFRYFQRQGPNGPRQHRDAAALQLAFYLASWGMYRGSSFPLQYAHTVHRDAVDVLADAKFARLWDRDFGASPDDAALVPVIIDLVDAIRNAYRPFAPSTRTAQPTDTLLTKVVLGTLGSVPACDRYFIDGFKRSGCKYSSFNRLFVESIFTFCQDNLASLQEEQRVIQLESGVYYPLMKIIDMYFWQLGMEGSAGPSADSPALT
jgi:hypothetical protein